MSDVHQATPPPANAPEARNPDGSIRDLQGAPTTSPSPTTESSPSTPPATSTQSNEPAKTGAAAGAPTEYQPFTLPEGFQADEAALSKASATFKELGLSQEQAQKVVDLYTAQQAEAAEAPFKMYDDLRNSWRDEVVKNPDLGDGTNLKPQVRETISRALDTIGDPQLVQDFKAAMDLTGAGDNPAFVRAFYNLSKLVTEGTSVQGRGPSPLGQGTTNRPRNAAQAMYPNLPSSNA